MRGGLGGGGVLGAINTPGALDTGPIKILWGGASIDDGTTNIGSARPTIDEWGGPPGARGYAYTELRRRLGARAQFIGDLWSPSALPGNGTTAATGATPERVRISEPRTATLPGQTIAQAAAAITATIAAAGVPDVYVYGGGVGDSSTTGAQMLADLTLLLTTFRALCPLAHVIVIAAPQDPGDATKIAHRNAYNAGIQATLDALGGRAARYWFANPYLSGADDTNATKGSVLAAFDIHGSFRMHEQRAAAVVEIITGLYTVPAGRRYPIQRARHPAHAEPTLTGTLDALLWIAPAEWTAFFVAHGATTWGGGAWVAFDCTPYGCPTTSGAYLSMFSTGGRSDQGFSISCTGEGAGGTYRRLAVFLTTSVSPEASAVGMLTDGRKTRIYVFLHPSTDPSFGGQRAISVWGSTPNGVELYTLAVGVSAWVIKKVPQADNAWFKINWGPGTTQNALPASYSEMQFGLGAIPSFDTPGTDSTGAAVPAWVDPVSGRGLRLIDFVESNFAHDRPIPGTLATWPGTEGTAGSVGEGSGGTALVMDTMSDSDGSHPYTAISSPVWRQGPAQPGDWAPPAPLTGTITTTTTVTDGSILATDLFIITRTADGGTVGGAPTVVVTAGQVVITYQSGDTSTYRYDRLRAGAGEPRP